MRRCPYCNRQTPWPLTACERCGTRVTDLDFYRPWRALRREAGRLRRALSVMGWMTLLVVALLGPTALVAALGPEHLVGPTLLALRAAAGMQQARAGVLAGGTAAPLLAALRFWLLLMGGALAILAGGRLAGTALALRAARGGAGAPPMSRVTRLAAATVAGLALLLVAQRAL